MNQPVKGKITAGSVIHVHGIPVKVLTDFEFETNIGNLRLLAENAKKQPKGPLGPVPK